MAKIILNLARLVVFQNSIWTPTAFEEGKEKTFKASFIFAPGSPEAKLVEKTILEVAKDTWKEKSASVLESIKGNANKSCFMNGNSKPDYDGFPGNLYLSAGNSVRPQILDRDGKTPLTQQDGRPYSGCYVRGILDIWAQDNKWGKAMRCKLLGIQFAKDGDAFTAGSVASEDDFTDLSDGADAPEVGMAASGGGGLV